MKNRTRFLPVAVFCWLLTILCIVAWTNLWKMGEVYLVSTIVLTILSVLSLLYSCLATFCFIRDLVEEGRWKRAKREMEQNEINFKTTMQSLGFGKDPAGNILEMSKYGKLIWAKKTTNNKIENIFSARLADDIRLESVKMDTELNLLGGRKRVICWSLDFIDEKKRFWATGISYWDHCRGEDGIDGDQRAKELYDFLEAKYGT